MASTHTHLNGAPRGVVAIGASAGGVEALTQLAAKLPQGLPYAVLVVLHMPSGAPSVLGKRLAEATPGPGDRGDL
jgi:two-component system, chemotaxis family, protein-glutamate methylesterase/glutaminase